MINNYIQNFELHLDNVDCVKGPFIKSENNFCVLINFYFYFFEKIIFILVIVA